MTLIDMIKNRIARSPYFMDVDPNTNFDVESLSLNDGTMGQVFRVTVGDSRYVVKSNPSVNGYWSDHVVGDNLLHREAQLYAFLKGTGVAPALFFAQTEGDEAHLVLEYLGPPHWGGRSFSKGARREDAYSVAEGLSLLHSLTFSTGFGAQSNQYDWALTLDDPMLQRAIALGLAELADVPQPFKAACRALKSRAVDYPTQSYEAEQAHTSAWALGHGDCWIANVIFSLDGPAQARFVDWQYAMWCPAMLDLALFARTSLQPDLYNAEIPHLIGRYHAALPHPFQSQYPLSECRADFAKVRSFAALTAAAILPTCLIDVDLQQTDSINARIQAITADLANHTTE